MIWMPALLVRRMQEPPFRKARLLMKATPVTIVSTMKPLPSVCFWASMFSNATFSSTTLSDAVPWTA